MSLPPRASAVALESYPSPAVAVVVDTATSTAGQVVHVVHFHQTWAQAAHRLSVTRERAGVHLRLSQNSATACLVYWIILSPCRPVDPAVVPHDPGMQFALLCIVETTRATRPPLLLVAPAQGHMLAVQVWSLTTAPRRPPVARAPSTPPRPRTRTTSPAKRKGGRPSAATSVPSASKSAIARLLASIALVARSSTCASPQARKGSWMIAQPAPRQSLQHRSCVPPS